MVSLNKREKMFGSDRMGFLCVLKTRSPLPEDLRSGSHRAGCPGTGYLSSGGLEGARAREIPVLGQLPGEVSACEAQKKPEPPLAALSLVRGVPGGGSVLTQRGDTQPRQVAGVP